jgi:signal transduction histidine kinase
MREARLSERQRIARELHDSVAHHGSGIAIQAKAAQAVAATDPAAAARAMATVEAQASRTLTEMRAMVGALREDDEPGPVAQRGVDDIVRLAGAGYAGPRVQVDLAGDLDALNRSTEAGLFRIAQESITNARRHARNASRIAVRIVSAGDEVELTIADDGDPIPASTHTGVGYGLAGMSERAALLGGTFEAGPGPRRGWITRAVLPRRGNAP